MSLIYNMQQNRKDIADKFGQLQSKKDLVELLNYVQIQEFGEDSDLLRDINLRSLNYFAFSKDKNFAYVQFSLNKKSGGKREITAPKAYLKHLQTLINIILTTVYEFHPKAHGFIANRSVVSNAQNHTGKYYVYNIDLKDFFPSIQFRRVKSVFELPPLNLNDELAFTLANLVSFDGVLPQGAPTSPIISNIIANRLDRRLNGLAKKFNCTYSRYADDITFSSDHNIYHEEGVFIQKVKDIISGQKFHLNTKKTRLQKRNFRQEVTGVTVNEKTNVPKRYIRNLRAVLNKWETKGYANAYEDFIPHYLSDKGHVKSHKPTLFNVLKGKIDYLKMVRGKNDGYYKKYKKKYDYLYHRDILWNGFQFSELIELIDKEGFSAVVQMFKLKVIDKNKYLNSKSDEIYFYQVVYNKKRFWIKSSDFSDTIEEHHNFLLVKNQLRIVEKSNKNGTFKVLMPLDMNYSKSTSQKAEATTGKELAKDEISFNVSHKEKVSLIRSL
ncbi:MAG: reverse transcriptase family protein, partial [Bacteroidota bacterium]